MTEQTTEEHYGKAFGLERAMDSAGAVVGPFCCVLLLWFFFTPQTIFALCLLPGVVAAALVLWGPHEARTTESRRAGTAAIITLPPAFRRFLVAVACFGLGDFSRTLLILWATEKKFDFANLSSMTLPALLYVLYNLIGSLSSYVGGHASDVVGRKGVLVGGYATAAVVSVVMMFDVRSVPVMILVFVGSGIYMGIQEAIERAMVADLLPEPGRSFGFGLLASINGVGDLVSSLLVGSLWHYVSPQAAFGYSAALMALGAASLVVLVPSDKMAKPTQ